MSSIPKVWFAGREILGTIHNKQLGSNFRSCSSKGKLRKPQAAGQARVCHTAVTGAFLCLVSEGCACVLSCDNSLVPHGKRSGILQAVMLEWVAISSSGGLSDPGIEVVSLGSPELAGGFLTTSTPWGFEEIISQVLPRWCSG